MARPSRKGTQDVMICFMGGSIVSCGLVRHTKIIATLGPASNSDAGLNQLISSGVDAFRLNFSHGSYEGHADMCRRIREAERRSGHVVAVMQDLSGPKIRTGSLTGGGPIELVGGRELTITSDDVVGTPERLSTTYPDLARAVGPGARLLLDDGRMELRVVESDGCDILVSVVHGGKLGEHKGINAPGVLLPAASPTRKDVEDLKFGLELGVDLVALSFVQSAADLQRARAAMTAAGGAQVPLIAKIERPQAVANIEEILGACQGVMVARGDLGLELPLEQVPRIQTAITRRARARGVPVILATQVLESMRTEPRPTRAEVTDAAHAVADGVDAIMLAGETAVGAHPSRAVRTLDAIIREAETQPWSATDASIPDLTGTGHGLGLCEAAVTLATTGHADAIVAVTREGKTARQLSEFRPSAGIYAVTEGGAVARRLAISWGVVPLVGEIGENVDSTARTAQQHLRDRGLLPSGAVVVFVNVNPDLGRRDANFLTLHRI